MSPSKKPRRRSRAKFTPVEALPSAVFGGTAEAGTHTLLSELADICGVASSFYADGERVDIPAPTLLAVLRTLGLPLPSRLSELSVPLLSDAISSTQRHDLARMLPPTVTAIAQRPQTIDVVHRKGRKVRLWLDLEDRVLAGDRGAGQEASAQELKSLKSLVGRLDPSGKWETTVDTDFVSTTFELPELPAGWHQLKARSGTKVAYSTLLVSPQRLSHRTSEEGEERGGFAIVHAPGANPDAPRGYPNYESSAWGQGAWHPWKLAELGYAPWRDLLQAALSGTPDNARGVIIENTLGLFKLWCAPEEAEGDGTFVDYDYAALVGVVILEAERAGASVVSEDGDALDPWVRDYLMRRGISGLGD